MNVLITGGGGYIGSITSREILRTHPSLTVLDDLSHGHRESVEPKAKFYRGNFGDPTLLAQIFQQEKIQAVVHFGALIEVEASVRDPYAYYHNNFEYTLTLLKTMVEHGIRKIVFSSTAAVYGHPDLIPIPETSSCHPINPYGRSKMMVEMALEDFCRAYGLGYVILRYFNVAGADMADPQHPLGENHGPETHLIPRIFQAAQKNDPVKIFGADYPTRDGTCVRDYVHVLDLAQAHCLALEVLVPGQGNVFNIGSESGFSVREVINACELVQRRKLAVKVEGRRPGDPPVLIADTQKIRHELNWRPRFPQIQQMVEHAWLWHSLTSQFN